MLRKILRYVTTLKIFEVHMLFISYILRIDFNVCGSGVVDSGVVWQSRGAGFKPR